MKRTLAAVLLGVLIGVVVLTTGSPADALDTPQQQIAALKQKLRAKNNTIADLRDERDAQDLVIGDLQAENTRLRNRDPLDQILNRDPDGQWAAMTAIWRAFPALDAGVVCGYDKANSPGDGIGLTSTSFTFFRLSGC